MSLIDEQLLRKQENKRIRQPNTLYATDLTHPCPRQTYYKITVDRPYGLESLRIFQAGNLLEDYWTTILAKRQATRVIATQIPAYHTITIEDAQWEIHGYADALTQHNKRRLVVHEVKSTKSTYYQQMTGEPSEDHVLQLQFYLNALGIDHGQIDYLDKQALLEGTTSIDLSFSVTRSEEIMQRLLHEATETAWALQSQTIPEGNPEAWNGKVCDYCNYRDLCQKEDEQ
jgi:CRISPR/Cas system-associated exonuclease Cas4 (RecB family)